MTEPTRIFHNPRCSKSRQTLELLTERGIEPEIIRYLETPPTEQILEDILERPGHRPQRADANEGKGIQGTGPEQPRA